LVGYILVCFGPIQATTFDLLVVYMKLTCNIHQVSQMHLTEVRDVLPNMKYTSKQEVLRGTQVKVKVTLRLTASQSVSLGVEPPSGAHDQIFFTI
jgi:hypothetical protein